MHCYNVVSLCTLSLVLLLLLQQVNLQETTSLANEVKSTSTTYAPPKSRRPGGLLRLVEAEEGSRIIFLFDLKTVPLFRLPSRAAVPVRASPPSGNQLAEDSSR